MVDIWLHLASSPMSLVGIISWFHWQQFQGRGPSHRVVIGGMTINESLDPVGDFFPEMIWPFSLNDSPVDQKIGHLLNFQDQGCGVGVDNSSQASSWFKPKNEL